MMGLSAQDVDGVVSIAPSGNAAKKAPYFEVLISWVFSVCAQRRCPGIVAVSAARRRGAVSPPAVEECSYRKDHRSSTLDGEKVQWRPSSIALSAPTRARASAQDEKRELPTGLNGAAFSTESNGLSLLHALVGTPRGNGYGI